MSATIKCYNDNKFLKEFSVFNVAKFNLIPKYAGFCMSVVLPK